MIRGWYYHKGVVSQQGGGIMIRGWYCDRVMVAVPRLCLKLILYLSV